MPTIRDTYRHGLAALLSDADRLGSTPDDIAARVVVLAELRHAIAAGLGEEAPDKGAPATTTDAPTLPPALRAEDRWIPWCDWACPCSDWPEVEYELRDGYRGTGEPKFLDWAHDSQPDPGDIIAYRRPQ